MSNKPNRRMVIKGARLIEPARISVGDLLIVDGKIEKLGGSIEGGDATEVDASGLYVMPGLIDGHVHFREPGLTQKESIESGSKAAIMGGVTSYLEMPNTKPATTTQARLEQKRSIASRTSFANYGFFIAASNDNLDALKAAHNTPGIKIFVGSSTGDLLVDNQETLERIFAHTQLPLAVHAEDEALIQFNLQKYADEKAPATHSKVRSPRAAARSVHRLCELASSHQHRLHILHMSTRAELNEAEGNPLVTREICVPHLFLDTTAYERIGNRAKVNPAVRDPSEVETMWAALVAGTFDMVATDHAPHALDEKTKPYPLAPSGIPSIENSLALMLDAVNAGRIDLETVAQLMCEGPAKTWGIANKGRLDEGYDADLVLIDLTLERTIENSKQWTRAGWSPWHGQSLKGWPVQTIVMGRVVARDGKIVAGPGGEALRFE